MLQQQQQQPTFKPDMSTMAVNQSQMHGETDRPTWPPTELQRPILWLKRDAEEHDRARQHFV